MRDVHKRIRRVLTPLVRRLAAQRVVSGECLVPLATRNITCSAPEALRLSPPCGLASDVPREIQDKAGRYRLPPVVVSELEALLVGRSAVGVLPGRGFILDTTQERKDYLLKSLDLRSATAGLRASWTRWGRACDKLDGPVCSLISMWDHHYFHWILESLLRLQGIEAYAAATGVRPRLLIRGDAPPFVMDSLRLLGWHPSELEQWHTPHAWVDRLVVSPVRRHEGRTSPTACRWLASKMAANLGLAQTHTPSRALYVSRAHAKSRRLLNEDKVCQALGRLGVECVQAEELSFEAQVRLFSDASVLIGPHGAGFTNLLWSSSAAIVELFERSYINPCYYALAAGLGRSYRCLVAESVGRDMRVEVDALIRTVEEAMDDVRCAAKQEPPGLLPA